MPNPFLLFLETYWKAIALAVLIGGLTVALKVQSNRLASVKQEYAQFKAKVEAEGEIAHKLKLAKEAEDEKLRKNLNAENDKLRADLADARKRLLNASAGSGRMPQISATSGSPDEIKVSRSNINGAIRKHVETIRAILGGTANLVVEGAEAVIDLDTAKSWATEQGSLR